MLYAIIRQRKVEVKKPVFVVRNGVNVDTLTLEMDDEWAKMDSIVAVFTLTYTKYEEQTPKAEPGAETEPPKKVPVQHVINKMMAVTFGEPVQVPWEVLVETGALTLSCTGFVGETQIMRTAKAKTFWNVIQEGESNGDEPLPPPTPGLLQQLMDAAAHAESAAISANEAAAIAKKTAEDLQAAADRGDFDGAPGHDGISPAVTTRPVEGGTEVTVTDKDGVHVFVVKDGKDGSDAKQITKLTTGLTSDNKLTLSATMTDGTEVRADDLKLPNGALLVSFSETLLFGYACDVPYASILEAYNSGVPVMARETDQADNSPVSGFGSLVAHGESWFDFDAVANQTPNDVTHYRLYDDERVTVRHTPIDKLVTIDIERRADESFWTKPLTTAQQIIDMVNAGKEVRLHFFDTVTNTGDQLYGYETTLSGVPYFRRNVVKPNEVSRINIGVQYNGEVKFTDIPYTPPIRAIYATCEDAAAPQSLTPNTWYVSKDMPRPSGEVGMFADVYWVNGRVDGIGYDVRLVWGAPGDPDNVLIVDQTNTSDKLVGEHSIPVRGTVRYQLVEANGHKHWQYVSGPLLPRQFSSATAAATADKLVPGMQLSYIPGEEIFVQLDQGNTAPVARIVPDEGPTLPVYGNGEGAKTGEIPAGYILQLKNAGDHWQILNSPGKGGGGTPVPGEDGGYYFPAVTQDDPNTATFDFAPSRAGMPPVNPKTITLPAGPAGERGPQGFIGATGERGPAGKTGPAGPQGISGVWVGSGDPPADNKANVLIDPDGSPDNTLATVAYARAVAKSMDLTGMSVGDKIEVAEIDSNGVPTKWRREGTLEHLATFKTGEVKPVSIDKDDQGRPFNLSKVILRIQAPGQFKRFIAVIKLKSGALAKDYGCAPVADAETSYFVIKTETSNGYYTSAASGAKFSNEAGPLTGDAYRYCIISAKDDPIVSVGTYNECPAGVTFDVWGVRL